MTLVPEQESRPSSTLGRFLLDVGSLTPDWVPAFEAVPRSLFLPDLIWAHDMTTGTSRPLHRGQDPAAWDAAVNSDIPVVTQWDDGNHTGTEPGHVPTSSASMPSVVTRMLATLDATAGSRVLEIGTGTGWNAALLSHRLGGENVVTVEVDYEVARAARDRLAHHGYRPRTVTADGSYGHPPLAPYDRVIATCGVRRIPHPWVRQTRPGGIILAPWGTHYGHQDALAKLTVHQDGTASGRFIAPVEFMKMRSQRLTRPPHPQGPDGADRTTTEVRIPYGKWDAFPFTAGLRVPNVTHTAHDRGEGTIALWLYSLTDPSWALVEYRNDGRTAHDVLQFGPRRLWDDVERAHTWWTAQGEPGLDRFGLTVDRAGQHLWLDDPANVMPR